MGELRVWEAMQVLLDHPGGDGSRRALQAFVEAGLPQTAFSPSYARLAAPLLALPLALRLFPNGPGDFAELCAGYLHLITGAADGLRALLTGVFRRSTIVEVAVESYALLDGRALDMLHAAD